MTPCNTSSLPTYPFIAVSKTRSPAEIEYFYHLGVRDFGENYVQEWYKKASQLLHLKEIRWHLIGPLQRNKIPFLVKPHGPRVYMLQTLNSIALCQDLERAFQKANLHLHVSIQMQVDVLDTTKVSGVPFVDVRKLCAEIQNDPHLIWTGFMGMGPVGVSKDHLFYLYTQFCQNALNLWHEFAFSQKPLPSISLGTSGDAEIALKAGSTSVRLGTALFGPRKPSSV